MSLCSNISCYTLLQCLIGCFVIVGGFGRGDPTGAGFRAALLSGPPGIGKTTSAVLVCKQAGFSFFEMNASDSRSKKILQETVGQALGNATLVDYVGGEQSCCYYE